MTDLLSLEEGVSYEEWASRFSFLERLAHSIRWGLGDLLVYGEAHFGERYAQVVSELPWKREYALQCYYVARMFPPERRHEDLSWTHHKILTGMSRDTQDHLLSQASQEQWSTLDLREVLQALRRLPGRESLHPEALQWFREVSLACHQLWLKPGIWTQSRFIEGRLCRITVSLDIADKCSQLRERQPDSYQKESGEYEVFIPDKGERSPDE